MTPMVEVHDVVFDSGCPWLVVASVRSFRVLDPRSPDELASCFIGWTR